MTEGPVYTILDLKTRFLYYSSRSITIINVGKNWMFIRNYILCKCRDEGLNPFQVFAYDVIDETYIRLHIETRSTKVVIPAKRFQKSFNPSPWGRVNGI